LKHKQEIKQGTVITMLSAWVLVILVCLLVAGV